LLSAVTVDGLLVGEEHTPKEMDPRYPKLSFDPKTIKI
jgi:hypothetical protein